MNNPYISSECTQAIEKCGLQDGKTNKLSRDTEREREGEGERAFAHVHQRQIETDDVKGKIEEEEKEKETFDAILIKSSRRRFFFSSFHALLFHRGFARFSIEDCKLSASERQQTRDSTTSPGSLPAELIVVASRQRHSSPCFTYLRFSTTRPFRVMSLVKGTSIAKERFNPRYPRTTLEILSIFSHFSESAPILLEFRRVGRNSKSCVTLRTSFRVILFELVVSISLVLENIVQKMLVVPFVFE